MIITLKSNINNEELDKVFKELNNKKIEYKHIQIEANSNEKINLIIITSDAYNLDEHVIKSMPAVGQVLRITTPYKLASRQYKKEDTIVTVGDVKIGGKEIVIMGGPCSVESEKQVEEIAKGVKEAGGKVLRGGLYKPRTSPYAFQGLESVGIEYLLKAKEKYNIPIISEIMGIDKLDEFVKNVDIIQVGARNIQNFELLKALGKVNKPILLKRGLANTIEEWLMSAEYILAGGNKNVILCERGIRTFEKATRSTLDLSVIPLVKKLTHLPIVVDPSHATGNWELVESVSLAAIAAGCDGLLIEVHNHPENAFSDGEQSLKIERFSALIEKGKKIAEVIGRKI